MAGFQALNTDGGGEYCGKVKTYAVISAAQNLAPGDSMLALGLADANGRQDIDVSGTTGLITGILISVAPQFVGESFGGTGLASGAAGEVQVAIDPYQEYLVDVSNGPLLVADVGLNVNVVVTAASNPNGNTVSNHSINATGKAVTATLPYRVVALREDADGVLGNRAVVRINNSNIQANLGV